MDLPELRDAAMVQIQGLRNLLGVLRNQIHGQHGVVYLQNVVDRLRTIEHDLLGLNLEPLWNPGNMEEAREITNAAIAELIDRLALVSDYVNEENDIENLDNTVNELHEIHEMLDPALIAPGN